MAWNPLSWDPKDTADVADYALDWAAFLGADTIATSAWTVPAGSGLVIDSATNTATMATVWLSGGTAGVYAVANRITTAGGRTYERSVSLTVAEVI